MKTHKWLAWEYLLLLEAGLATNYQGPLVVIHSNDGTADGTITLFGKE